MANSYAKSLERKKINNDTVTNTGLRVGFRKSENNEKGKHKMMSFNKSARNESNNKHDIIDTNIKNPYKDKISPKKTQLVYKKRVMDIDKKKSFVRIFE